jgi:transcriptional regulator with XRE-family HTH domain
MLVHPAKIRRLASAKGWDQASLAREAGLSRPYMSQILSTERNPSPLAVKAIADALGVLVTDLGEDEVTCPRCGHHFNV